GAELEFFVPFAPLCGHRFIVYMNQSYGLHRFACRISEHRKNRIHAVMGSLRRKIASVWEICKITLLE
ncbi:MAG: hypothetical protein DRH04_06420, partial [Deltaproteobacteria bacterium]